MCEITSHPGKERCCFFKKNKKTLNSLQFSGGKTRDLMKKAHEILSHDEFSCINPQRTMNIRAAVSTKKISFNSQNKL